MKRLLHFACARRHRRAVRFRQHAQAQSRAQYEALVATHAKANNVPEALVHRVIVRESKYQPRLVGRGGTIGLMQIKLATARGLGYTGDAAGLRDPDTNLTYGVKYLAGAYRAANGDHDRAVHYYASGYYYAAKRQRLEQPCRSPPCSRVRRRRKPCSRQAVTTRKTLRGRCRTGEAAAPVSPRSPGSRARLADAKRWFRIRRRMTPVQTPQSRVDTSPIGLH